MHYFSKIIIAAFLFLYCATCTLEAQEAVYTDAIETEVVSELESIQSGFRAVSRAVLPAIVRIDVQQQVEENINPFDFYFGPEQNEEDEDDSERFYDSGLGSGVIVSKIEKTYYVLTNSHVVKGSERIKVTLHDGRVFPAELVGEDERKDAALVSFEPDTDDIYISRLGDSDSLQVGDWVLAMGAPFGYQNTVTAGIVSALERSGPMSSLSDFIQTDAAINQGNSGGALVNLRGEIVGINTWITTRTGANVGLGFAIPINDLKNSISQFIETGEAEYGWLGVSTKNLSQDVADSLSADSTQGAFIPAVYADSPADLGGIFPGDIIIEVDGEEIENSNELVRLVGNLEAGKTVSFTVIRNGREREVSVTIDKRPSEINIATLSGKSWPGFEILPLTEDLLPGSGLDEAYLGQMYVLSTVSRSLVDIAGIRRGDIISRVNDKKINSLREFYEIIGTANALSFSVLREGQSITITIEKP